ncbi:MAG: tetratricopeptide repeat protein, partial [Pseudomonadota bacterium]
ARAGAGRDPGSRLRQAAGQYLRLVEQYPNNLSGRVALAEISAFVQAWDEAERHGRAAQELDSEDVRVKAVGAVLDYRQALFDQDSVARENLIETAEALIEERPNNVSLRHILVDGYNWREDYEASLEQLDASIAQQPNYKPLYFSKLSVLGNIGDTVLIEDHLRAMAERFPDDEDINATMIRFLLSTGDNEKAEAFFRSIADPTAPEIGPYLAFVQFLSEVKGPEAAMEEVTNALETTTHPELLRSLRAGMLFDAGERDTAIAEMESLLADEPQGLLSSDIRVALARMLLATGNEVGARRRVEEVLEADSVNIEALKMQAAWLIEGDRADEALGALRIGLAEDSNDAQLLLLQASAYNRLGSHTLAIDSLALAATVSGNAPDPSLRYANALLENGRVRPAEQILVESLRSNPADIGLLSALGQIYLSEDDFSRAEGVRRRLEEIGTEEALELEGRVRVALLAGQQQTAELLQELENMATADGGDAGATIVLIRTRLASGEADAALTLAENALAEDPDNLPLRMALAATRSATGDADAAIEIYQKAVDDGLANGRTWLTLASSLLQVGREDEGNAALAQGLEAFPDHPEMLWMKASLLEAGGDIDGSIVVYERLYDLNSSSSVIANNLASLLATWRSDDPQSIERAFTIARRLNGTNVPAFQDTYGWILHLRGQSDDAVDYLEPAAAALVDDPVVQYHLGMAYLAEGRSQEAAEQLQRALNVPGADLTMPQLQIAAAELEKIESELSPGGAQAE